MALSGGAIKDVGQLVDADYNLLEVVWENGVVKFCVPAAQAGQLVYVDIPYLLHSGSVQIPETSKPAEWQQSIWQWKHDSDRANAGTVLQARRPDPAIIAAMNIKKRGGVLFEILPFICYCCAAGVAGAMGNALKN